MKRIYTTGYSGKRITSLPDLLRRLDAVLFDIRYSPNSRVPHWRQGALEELLGSSYLHVPALGNINYKTGGEILINDLERGIRTIRAEQKSIVLLCACEDAARCHRSVIARSLGDLGMTVEELPAWDEDRQLLLLG